MDAQTSNAFFGEALRQAHTAALRRPGERTRLIRLPEPAQISFHRNGPDIHIEMTADGVKSNMQTNGAAFEGWSLALRLWLWPIAREITLNWTPAPLDEKTGELNPHYSRFLYRVQKFHELFPDWFRIGTPEHLDACEVRKGTPLYLNVAGAVSNDPAEPKRETKIERELVTRYADLFRERFHLVKVDRQFPVGLYRSPDLKGRVFTAGTSAIDIVGVNESTFSVFELKAGGNIDIGGLGELLFYSSVIRDAAGPNPRFQFGHPKSETSRSTIGPKEVKNAKAVRAFFLAEKLHPLLEHPVLACMLNEAASRQKDMIPLTFEAVRISGWDDQAPRFKRFSA